MTVSSDAIYLDGGDIFETGHFSPNAQFALSLSLLSPFHIVERSPPVNLAHLFIQI